MLPCSIITWNHQYCDCSLQSWKRVELAELEDEVCYRGSQNCLMDRHVLNSEGFSKHFPLHYGITNQVSGTIIMRTVKKAAFLWCQNCLHHLPVLGLVPRSTQFICLRRFQSYLLTLTTNTNPSEGHLILWVVTEPCTKHQLTNSHPRDVEMECVYVYMFRNNLSLFLHTDGWVRWQSYSYFAAGIFRKAKQLFATKTPSRVLREPGTP